MAFLTKILKYGELSKVPVRYKNGPNHWSVLRKKKTNKDKALDHFDDFYGKVYGDSWVNIRTALLSEENKHIAVVNNFSDTDRIQNILELCGAMNLKSIYDVWFEEYSKNHRKKRLKTTKENLDDKMSSILEENKSHEVQSLYPNDYNSQLKYLSRNNKEDEECSKIDKPLESICLMSMEKGSDNQETDASRIINSSSDLSGLYEFVPATKLKGLEDWVLESEHYDCYKKGGNFVAKVEEETILSFPEHLKLYTFEEDNNSRFPSPKKGTTGVLDYYLFDGGSALPVLALDLKPGDVVLDMCAAPGGKTLAILQTLMPRLMVANDIQLSRVNRLKRVINEYLADMGQWHDKLFILQQDACTVTEKNMYNKILVDVPCTTDRHVLHEDNNNIFKSTRVKERLRLPELQANILTNALKLVTVGGTVVYSTCSLSPIQNDGVVHVAIKRAWEENNSNIIVKDMSMALNPLRSLFNFGDFGLKYGHIVVPTLRNNWGPMYFCKMVRTR